MNRRDLFRLAGAVAVAPRAMLAAPVRALAVPVAAAPVGLASGIAIREWQSVMYARARRSAFRNLAELQVAMAMRDLEQEGYECDSV